MKELTKISVLGVVILVFVVGTFSAFHIQRLLSCDQNSSATRYVRSLPDHRLQKLYYDMKAQYRARQSDSRMGEFYIGESNMPAEFSDLSVSVIYTMESRILVRRCIDGLVQLVFNGFDDRDVPSEIELQLRNGQNWYSEVIWSQSEDDE